jgi:hypothetical protein
MVRGAPITMSGTAAPGIAGSQHCNNAWPTCAGLAGTVDPVRTPRQDHIGRLGTRGAILIKWRRLAQKLRQLGDVCRDPLVDLSESVPLLSRHTFG